MAGRAKAGSNGAGSRSGSRQGSGRAWAGFSFSRLREVVSAARDAERRRSEVVRLEIRLDPLVPRDLALALREALMPQTAGALVHVALMEVGAPVRVNASADVAVVAAAGSDALVSRHVRALCSCGVPTCVICESSLDAAVPQGAGGVSVVAANDVAGVLDGLGEWLATACEKDLALASNFPIARRALAGHAVSTCAMANAAVGAVDLVHGADLPVMCANQAKMALDVAAAYGHGASAARALEVGAALACGVAGRAASRALVSLAPPLAPAVRAGVAWGMSHLLGRVLVARFEVSEDAGRPWDEASVPQFPLADNSRTYVDVRGGE